MHLDKALIIWPRWDAQASLQASSAAQAVQPRRGISVEDVRERAIRVAEMCIVNGTTTLRTHADITAAGGLVAIQGVLAAREACREWIDMQVTPFPIRGFGDSPDEIEDLMRKAVDIGADLIAGVPEADASGIEHVDRIFALAKEYDLDIDFHTDMVPADTPFLLPYIAEKAIAEGWQGRVLAGHCFALAHVTPDDRQRAIEKCKEAQVSICISPFASIQQRVIEPVSGGVNVTYMSDNIRDTWSSFGNADMLQLALFVGRLGSWRTSQELDHLLEMGTAGAARAIGLAQEHGTAVGKRADLVILEAKSGHQAIITQARKLWVIKNGCVVARSGELLLRHGLNR